MNEWAVIEKKWVRKCGINIWLMLGQLLFTHFLLTAQPAALLGKAQVG